MSGERYLVTSALPYANGPLHVGQIVGAYLPADIFVRYLRARGEDVLYICGTDEHGVPITLTAEREGKDPQEVVDYWWSQMRETFRRFNVSFDNFSRTSLPLHGENTRLFYRKLKESGYITREENLQMYSPSEGRFLPDRYVEGTCTYCGYREARGDQCDNCGRWYESHELINPYSKATGGPAEPRETTHLYLNLPEFSQRLEEWVSSQGHWRTPVKNSILGMIESGLQRRPITRDILWGVEVPEEGFEDKRFYVWFDALIGYVSSTMEWAQERGEPERWRDYWQDSDTRMIHFIGKDNTVFHATVWPAMLMGVAEDGEEPYVPPYDIPANEFMKLVNGEPQAMQMSTSRNLAVWLHEALDLFPADPLRFYLASALPETADVLFSWHDFQNRVNSDLIGNLANYVNRSLSFTEKYFDGELKRPEKLPEGAHEALEEFKEIERRYDRKMLDRRPREALSELLALGRRANQFFDAEAPWKSRKEAPERARASLYVCCVLLGSVAFHAEPYVPEAIQRLRSFFSGPIEPVPEELPQIYRVSGAEPLFKRIEDSEVEEAERPLRKAAAETA
jgi:methionyl-tRNA synthetase